MRNRCPPFHLKPQFSHIPSSPTATTPPQRTGREAPPPERTVHTLTCGDEENACAQDDVVSAPVKLTGGDAQPSQEEQAHAHDGEDAGGAHSTFTQTQSRQGRVRRRWWPRQRARPPVGHTLKSSWFFFQYFNGEMWMLSLFFFLLKCILSPLPNI